jgi:hypothetical protein
MPPLTYFNTSMLPTMVVASVMLAVSILSCVHFIKKWARMRRSMRLRLRAHGPPADHADEPVRPHGQMARGHLRLRASWRRCPRARRLHRLRGRRVGI